MISGRKVVVPSIVKSHRERKVLSREWRGDNTVKSANASTTRRGKRMERKRKERKVPPFLRGEASPEGRLPYARMTAAGFYMLRI